MELPVNRSKNEYLHRINLLIAELKTAVEDDSIKSKVTIFQKKLDVIAERYQEDSNIGEMKYKLYETQAFIHYFQKNNEEAAKFIEQAVATRGESYPKAERLLDEIRQTKSLDKVSSGKKKHKNLNGLEGWLALYIVGLGVTVVINAVSLFGYGNTLNDLETIRSQNYEMYQSFQPAIWFEIIYQVVCIALAVYIIVLLAKRKIRAKSVAIVYMLGLVVGSVIDYSWTSSLASMYSLDITGTLKEVSSAIGRSIFYAVIWIPYFIVSKRVKTTLTKE